MAGGAFTTRWTVFTGGALLIGGAIDAAWALLPLSHGTDLSERGLLTEKHMAESTMNERKKINRTTEK